MLIHDRCWDVASWLAGDWRVLPRAVTAVASIEITIGVRIAADRAGAIVRRGTSTIASVAIVIGAVGGIRVKDIFFHWVAVDGRWRLPRIRAPCQDQLQVFDTLTSHTCPPSWVPVRRSGLPAVEGTFHTSDVR